MCRSKAFCLEYTKNIYNPIIRKSKEIWAKELIKQLAKKRQRMAN